MSHRVRHDLVLRILSHETDAGRFPGRRSARKEDPPRKLARRRDGRDQLTQKGRLAASRRTAEAQESPVRYRKGHPRKSGNGNAGVGEGHILERDARHDNASFPLSKRGRKQMIP